MDTDMEEHNDDAASKEIVNVLAKELLVTKKQLKELQGRMRRSSNDSSAEISLVELESVKTQNEELRQKLQSIQSNQERLRLVKVEDAEFSGLVDRGKLEYYKGKIAELKAELVSSREENKLTNDKMIQKLEKAKARREKHRQALAESQQEILSLGKKLSAAISERNEALTQIEDSAQSANFDPVAFLRTPSKSTTIIPDHSIPFLHQESFVIDEGARIACSENEYLTFNRDEIVWAKGESHFITLGPLFRYNPKFSLDGSWQRPHIHWTLQNQLNKEQSRIEIFAMRDCQWYYHGQYACVGWTQLEVAEVTKLNCPPAIMEYVIERTVLFKELVPPFLVKTINNMYAQGALSVQCCGFRYCRNPSPFLETISPRDVVLGMRTLI
ncbi:hypothetical protein ABKN59_001128 [Abortiporus biennis]